MKILILIICAAFSSTSFAFADEGMWTLNNFPSKAVKEKYNITLDKQWLQHAMRSSARLAGGCSASFVSKDGLIMTNHHCAHSCIEQLSTASKDYVASGFYAKILKDEVKCPEIEINKLVEITDVTKQVQDATKNLKGKEFHDKLKATTSRIEKECANDSDLIRCEVVTLYRGGQFHLYRYQRYQDVRLVFAPEFAAAFFGGDPDNFNFPRYDLDVSFLRVYEKNAPLSTTEYFKWSANGPKEDELSFVIGNPGNTSRLMTVTDLKFIRDHSMMDTLLYLAEFRGFLNEFAQRGPEQKRISGSRLFGTENSYKAQRGRHAVLMDAKLIDEKAKSEKKLRDKVNANPLLKKQFGDAWNEVDQAYEVQKKIYREHDAIERTNFGSRLYGIARTLVRAADELAKPNEVRFHEFTDSRVPQLKQSLFSDAPIYDEFEMALLNFHLIKLREVLGPDHPVVKKLLGTRSPAEISEDLVKKTKLKDKKERERLFAGGKKAIDESSDPLIKFYLLIESDGRKLRENYEENVESKLKRAGEKIAKAQFAVYGDTLYPNATFSMRMSYGKVKGYEEKGKKVKPLTDFQGAFDRHTGSYPFALPESWLNSKSKLNLRTSLNFASTNDITGGNSGSPVINKDAEIIGLIFDGNIQSLGGDYGYDESVNRAVSVSSAALLESLKSIYSADRIVTEITGSSAK